MAEVKASLRYSRIGPRKVRVILDQVKKQSAIDAVATLENLNKKGAKLLLGVLKSAMASAESKELDVNKLVIKDVRADGGPSYKRALPRAMGSVHRILKRTTHISVVLSDEIELEKRLKKETAKAETETPEKAKAK